jgi:epoxide hydrolase-like predicted phosphatase
MPRGLLVDFGGVLTTPVFAAFEVFAREEGLDPAALLTTMRDVVAAEGNLFHRVERGDIDTDEFEAAFAALIAERLGVIVAAPGLKTRMFAAAGPDEAMLDVLRIARATGVRTGLVSNSWGVTNGGYPLDQFPELFDTIVISGEVRLRKPQREIYLLAAKRIACEPADCVFVDDFRVNVEGAEAAGMAGVHHTDTATTIRRLEELLGVPLSQPGSARGGAG